MKTLEELRATPLVQLKAIGRDLQIPFAANISHEKLAKLLFETQQPDPDMIALDEENKAKALEAEQAKAEEKKETAAVQVDAKLSELAEFFAGNIEEGEEDDNGTFNFAIVDPATGDVIVEGTYAELVSKMEEVAKIRAEEAFQSAKNFKEAQVPVDPAALSIPDDLPTGANMPQAPSEHIQDIERELGLLRKLGLRFAVSNDAVDMSFGGRNLTTTVHQPLHRIVGVAEQLISKR